MEHTSNDVYGRAAYVERRCRSAHAPDDGLMDAESALLSVFACEHPSPIGRTPWWSTRSCTERRWPNTAS